MSARNTGQGRGKGKVAVVTHLSDICGECLEILFKRVLYAVWVLFQPVFHAKVPMIKSV
jgi:hypothetical protein